MVAPANFDRPSVDVSEADVSLTLDEHCRHWQSEGLEMVEKLAELFNAGQISHERYTDAMKAMASMARHRREFEKAVFGEELKA